MSENTTAVLRMFIFFAFFSFCIYLGYCKEVTKDKKAFVNLENQNIELKLELEKERKKDGQ